jgi:hypothetical protein
MKSKSTSRSRLERARLIILVRLLKPAAIVAGFDWPTKEPEMATVEELRELVEDVSFFIRSYANGEV